MAVVWGVPYNKSAAGWLGGGKKRTCESVKPFRDPVDSARDSRPLCEREKGVRLAQKMRVGPCIPEGVQL
jgi:hypothetical protein